MMTLTCDLCGKDDPECIVFDHAIGRLVGHMAPPNTVIHIVQKDFHLKVPDDVVEIDGAKHGGEHICPQCMNDVRGDHMATRGDFIKAVLHVFGAYHWNDTVELLIKHYDYWRPTSATRD